MAIVFSTGGTRYSAATYVFCLVRAVGSDQSVVDWVVMFFLLLLVFVISSGLGFIAGRDHCLRRPLQAAACESQESPLQALLQSRHLLLAIALVSLAVAPFALSVYSDEVCQLLPVALQKSSSMIMWLIGVSFFGAFGSWSSVIAIRMRDPQKNFFTANCVVVNLLLLFIGFRCNAEIVHLITDRQTDDGIILQSHSVSCAAATVANVARLCDVDVFEQDVARLVGTTRTGTSMAGMRYGLNRLGIANQTLNGGMKDLSKVQHPAILIVDHPAMGEESHALLYRQPSGDQYELWDPLTGRKLVTASQLRPFWSGKAIECRVDDSRS